jgi:hypothetical protein
MAICAGTNTLLKLVRFGDEDVPAALLRRLLAGAPRDNHAPFQRLVIDVEPHAPQQIAGHLGLGVQRRDGRGCQQDDLLAFVAGRGELLLDLVEVSAALDRLDAHIGRHRRARREQPDAGAIQFGLGAGVSFHEVVLVDRR